MTTRKACILGVDDDLLMREALRDTLTAEGHEVKTVESAAQAMAELEKQEWDIVLADLSLPRVSGLELLDRIKRSWPTTEVIVITGQGSIATAVDAIKRGAYHYLTKPFTAEEIIHLVHQALERRRLVDRKERLEEELWQARGVHRLGGQSEAVRRVRRMVQTGGGRTDAGWGGSSKPRGGRCSSTRSARCSPGCRRSSCARSRSERSSGWAARRRFRWTCGSSRRRTAISRKPWRRGCCAKTSTIV